ncbi:MAG: YwiC-like family protein [Chloroflexi bacterium]|nr:YwiC-like family protein [Chloroflexota bacterium]
MLKIDTGPQTARRTPRLRLGAACVPNDHGAYAMLLVPMLLGLIVGAVHGVAPNSNPPVTFTLFALSLISLFFASEPLSIAFKPRVSTPARRRALLWLGIYLFAASLAGAPLLLIWNLWALGWFLAPAAALLLLLLIAVKLRKQRSLGMRLPGIVGLTLSAPAAYYIATGTLDETAWGVWAACAIYFAGTLFNVRAWFEANKQKKAGIATPRLPAWLVASILTYLATGALIIWACALMEALPWAALAAFVPSLLRASWTLWRTPVHLSIKTVGLIEFAQSFLFALLLLVTVTSATQ